jgi:DNA-binding Lrp family transcriptional regulator
MAAAIDAPEPLPIDWERLARTEMHPIRIDILELLRLDGGRTLSANEMSFELRRSLSKVHYHVQALAKGGFLVPVHHFQVRGATEHFFCLVGWDGSDLFRRPPFDQISPEMID